MHDTTTAAPRGAARALALAALSDDLREELAAYNTRASELAQRSEALLRAQLQGDLTLLNTRLDALLRDVYDLGTGDGDVVSAVEDVESGNGLDAEDRDDPVGEVSTLLFDEEPLAVLRDELRRYAREHG